MNKLILESKFKVLAVFVVIYFLCLAMCHNAFAYSAEDNGPVLDATNNAYIFIGDSRYVQMEEVCHLSSLDNEYMVAKTGMGYDWLVKEAIPEAQNIINSHPGKNWTLIIGLGINDLSNIDKYLYTYSQLAGAHNVVLASVNPVQNHEFIKNSEVEAFNAALKTLGLPFIDTYSVLVASGFNTEDCLHFSGWTYVRINELYQEWIEKNESYSIYRMLVVKK